jgi:hypothetical protein
MASDRRTASTFFQRARLISRFSVTASMIQSHAAILPRSFSKLPGVTRAAPESTKKRSGTLLQGALDPLRREDGRKVKQQGGNTGVGEVGGDPRAHRASSENRYALNGPHGLS